jgi:hypothetical protein
MILKHQEERPVAPEGVTKFLILKAGSGTSELSGKDYFSLTVRDLQSGIEFKDHVYITTRAAWKMEQLLGSVRLQLPEGEYRLEPGDFEYRVGYGEIKHRKLEKSGRLIAEFDNFLSKEQAIAKAPALASIADPDDAILDVATLPPARKPKAAAAAAPAVPAPATSDDNEPAEIDF